MRKAILLFLSVLFLAAQHCSAQSDSTKTHRIAIFIPLYLDSAYDAAENYRFDKSVPRYIDPGLEFYMGVSCALDSLEKEGAKLDVNIFDSKGSKSSIAAVTQQPSFDSTDLIIGSVNGSEYLQLAAVAKQKNIPFVSATYPNDGGITGNPFVVIVNSKLNTHLQTVYNYLLRNMGTNKLVLFRRKNPQDDRIIDVFKSLNASSGGTILHMETVILDDNFTAKDIQSNLDSMRQNVVICGSLDENFGRELVTEAATLNTNYQMTIVGMPTWDNIRELSKPELKSIPIIYPTTFFNSGQDAWGNQFTRTYSKMTYTRPTDLAFKGFEVTYYFSRLLGKYNKAILANLNDRNFRLITEYEFKPIFWSKASTTPDYYENKRVYMVKRINGTLLRVN